MRHAVTWSFSNVRPFLPSSGDQMSPIFWFPVPIASITSNHLLHHPPHGSAACYQTPPPLPPGTALKTLLWEEPTKIKQGGSFCSSAHGLSLFDVMRGGFPQRVITTVCVVGPLSELTSLNAVEQCVTGLNVRTCPLQGIFMLLRQQLLQICVYFIFGKAYIG